MAGSTVGCVVACVLSSAAAVSSSTGCVSGAVSSDVTSGVVARSAGASVFGASGPGSGAFPLSRACSSSVAGSDILDDDDINDAEEEGARGRERRRSFCLLF